MTMTHIDPVLLHQTALRILVADLSAHGNQLSANHHAALDELVGTFTAYATGTQTGRVAFGLPTGMGKTSAVVAFIAAVHQLGLDFAIAAAASKVAALHEIRKDLVRHGVPDSFIGLKHATDATDIPSTGNESRQFQLVTHARVRGGSDFELFGNHQGRPRALMIYDETLWRSESLHFNLHTLRAAIAALPHELAGRPRAAEVVAFLGECMDRLDAAAADPAASCSNGRGVVLTPLPVREEAELAAYRRAVRSCRLSENYKDVLDDFIEASQETFRVLMTRQGTGMVHCREVIPPELRNVVVLDASAPVRELARLDDTVQHRESFRVADLKRFDRVKVTQVRGSGGRHTATRHSQEMAKEVADLVKESWDRDGGGILIFTYKDRGNGKSRKEQVRDAIKAKGIDLTTKMPDGIHDRLQFLTFGDETSLNGYEFCTTVILAGLLQRSHLDVVATMRGQQNDLAAGTPGDMVAHIIETEAAHVAYQAASRGSCRKIMNGMAEPMHFYLVHGNSRFQELMNRVMPGARWDLRNPTHLASAVEGRLTLEMLDRIVDFLRTLPSSKTRISSYEVKRALGVGWDDATDRRYGRAKDLLSENCIDGWEADGRSLVRGADLYGFVVRTT